MIPGRISAPRDVRSTDDRHAKARLGRPALLVLTPLRIEAIALRRGGAVVEVVVTGMGRRASERAARRLAGQARRRPVAVAGFCGSVAPDALPGDVVVATELRGPEGVLILPSAPALAERLREAGLLVVAGPLLSVDHLVRGAERTALAHEGTVAVDMESYWLAAEVTGSRRGRRQADGRIAVVRVVSDGPRSSSNPASLLASAIRGYRALAQVGGPLRSWGEGVVAVES